MGVSHSIEDYLHSPALEPLLVNGDAFELLPLIPSASIDLILTSPPYFQKRDYPSSSLGNESNYQDYLDALMTLFKEVYRVLKPSGSFLAESWRFLYRQASGASSLSIGYPACR